MSAAARIRKLGRFLLANEPGWGFVLAAQIVVWKTNTTWCHAMKLLVLFVSYFPCPVKISW